MKITRELCAGSSVLGVQNLKANNKFDQPKPFQLSHTHSRSDPDSVHVQFSCYKFDTSLCQNLPKLAAPPAPEKHGEKLCTLYIIQPTDGTRRHRPFFRRNLIRAKVCALSTLWNSNRYALSRRSERHLNEGVKLLLADNTSKSPTLGWTPGKANFRWH